VIDATVAGASADSYLTVDEADALAIADLGRQARQWLASDLDTKEAALKRATRDVDDFVDVVPSRWSYDAATGAPLQALLFPRGGDALEGVPFIPSTVVRATYEQAAYLILNADAIDAAASRRAQGLSNFANPDGTGGTLSTDPHAGRLAPRVERLLTRLSGASVIAEIVTT
jgi:hypothetical protein